MFQTLNEEIKSLGLPKRAEVTFISYVSAHSESDDLKKLTTDFIYKGLPRFGCGEHHILKAQSLVSKFA